MIEEIGAGNESRGRTYFVSRHPGARGWAAGEGLAIDAFVDHINIDRIRPNDSVIGTLPVNLAAEICARGGHYLHLSLDLQAQMRGQELTAEQMRQCGARLEPYLIQRAAQHDGD
nr:CRISPR-associated protein Csx16 [Thiorhodococcus minor]